MSETKLIDPHVGRSWVGHPLEDDCPCPQQPCGLVRMNEADPSCTQHTLSAAKSMRQIHNHDECPARKEQLLMAANELEPVFKIQVRLDGDDWPPTMIENVRFALDDALKQMQVDGLILDYTVEND